MNWWKFAYEVLKEIGRVRARRSARGWYY